MINRKEELREALLHPPPYANKKTYCAKIVIGGCTAVLLVVFVVLWILQLILYTVHTTMNGCGKGTLSHFDYDVAGGAPSNWHDAGFNVMPAKAYLTESPRSRLWGRSFSVMPTNDGSQKSAPVGVWWLAWGPIFKIYTYKSIWEHTTTLYMRRNLVSLGQSHRVMRCDGFGPEIIFEEGTSYFGNRVRQFLGTTQSFTYKVYVDGTYVAFATETKTGYPSMTFSNATDLSMGKIADAVFQEKLRGGYASWLIQNTPDNSLPYYVISAAGLLYALHTIGRDSHKKVSSFLEIPSGKAKVTATALSNASITDLRPEATHF